MAALLKKRALAEYSRTVVVSQDSTETPKRKKLRLNKVVDLNDLSDTTLSLELDIKRLNLEKDTEENMKTLSTIVFNLPSTVSIEEMLLQRLKIFLFSESNSVLKAKCLSTFKYLSICQTDFINVLEDIVKVINKEKSDHLKIIALNVLLKLMKCSSPGENARLKLLEVAKKFMHNSSTSIKCKCLELIGEVFRKKDSNVLREEGRITQMLKFSQSFINSYEPRIRTAALKTMLDLHENGAHLGFEEYQKISTYLHDDYESVKVAAVQFLWAISQSFPEKMITYQEGNSDTIRLIDDAFGKICHGINDPCVQVRIVAASLLGKMPQVSQNFLEQTLDKKLMSDMRRTKSAHERQWDKVRTGEWSSGNKWADDKPKEILDKDSVSLIDSGATGAFIHGLEDEYMEVRSATLDSLCALALRIPDFSTLALDFLVDMFNDEIEAVRVKAIDSLTKISAHIVLWEDQLEIIISALEDSSVDIRESLHRMISVCRFMTPNCIKMCLESLLENLKKYPQDKKSIWRCLQGVGTNHPWAVLPLVPNFLSMHSFFDVPETDLEDPAYISVLILVFNAAKGCPTLPSLLEEKLYRHYHYLRATLSSLVPDLRLAGGSVESTLENSNSSSLCQDSVTIADSIPKGKSLLKELISKLSDSQSLNPGMQATLRKQILTDLKRIGIIDIESSATAKFTALYMRAYLLYSSCVTSITWAQLTQNTPSEFMKMQIETLRKLCFKMQYGFTGLSFTELGAILQMKLRVLALNLAYIVRGSNASALALCQNLIQQACHLQEFFEKHTEIEIDTFTTAIFNILDTLSDLRPGTLVKHLIPIFDKHEVPLVFFSSPIKMTKAIIVEPSGESDTPLKFTSGLLLGVLLDVEIFNTEDISFIRVQVTYPDDQVHLICPRFEDFRKTSQDETRLLTTISISHNTWTEPCSVSISIVMDLSGLETNFTRNIGHNSEKGYLVPLSGVKKVLVSPRPAKRGI